MIKEKTTEFYSHVVNRRAYKIEISTMGDAGKILHLLDNEGLPFVNSKIFTKRAKTKEILEFANARIMEWEEKITPFNTETGKGKIVIPEATFYATFEKWVTFDYEENYTYYITIASGEFDGKKWGFKSDDILSKEKIIEKVLKELESLKELRGEKLMKKLTFILEFIPAKEPKPIGKTELKKKQAKIIELLKEFLDDENI